MSTVVTVIVSSRAAAAARRIRELGMAPPKFQLDIRVRRGLVEFAIVEFGIVEFGIPREL